MNSHKEWIVRYHGNLKETLSGTDTMFDIINERYAIIKATEGEMPYLRALMQIEYIEESRPIHQIVQEIDSVEINPIQKEKHGISGKGITVGWISHKESISYNDYNTYDGKSRILCVHDGIRRYSRGEKVYMGSGKSPMCMCVGNWGIAPGSKIVLVNWQKAELYTSDAIRAVRFIIANANSKQNPLIIYFPFDISEDTDEDNNLIREIISDMTLWGKIAIVSSIKPRNKTLNLNLGASNGLIYSTCPPLTIGVLSLLMDWGITKGKEPYLYGQALRTYYIKNTVSILKKDDLYTKKCSLEGVNELLELLIPTPEIEGFRTLDLAYEFAKIDEVIDAFITYNSVSTDLTISLPQTASFYPLVSPYLGVRGTVKEVREILSGYLEIFITGSLAYVLGREPLQIIETSFKKASIFNTPTILTGAGTLIGIIDTGIDYTNPAFIDSNGQTRILSIWDQTQGAQSPFGYGTIYDQEIINEALRSPDPFSVVPHKDEWGSGTMLAGVAAGFSEGSNVSYKGVAPKADIVVVKLIPATPVMQRIYHSQYNPLGFSALDIARAFEYLATLSNQHQKPISICMPMGTNSGPHDGTSVLDTIIMSYSENPGISVVLPSGEEANKNHHASGNLNDDSEQEIKLRIPKKEGGFIIEIWASFGDQIEATLTSPASEVKMGEAVLLNKSQTYEVASNSFVWSQGSKIDQNTGCQVMRFRLINPLEGDWVIRIRAIVTFEGIYHIWIPKTEMILPGTVLLPSNPLTTAYNTSCVSRLITVSCYDRASLSPTPSSGRGFTRDNMVKPDFMVPGVNIPGPLPGDKWGLITGTAVAAAITVGVSSLMFENQLLIGEELANTITMKAKLSRDLKREPTISYPNPSRGYGLLDISTIINYKLVREVGDGKPEEKTTGDQWED